MTGTLERFGGAVAMVMVLCVACTFGQIELRFNGSTASPLYLQPGDVAVFQVSGPPDAPFAAMITPEPAFVVTPFGILHGNPLNADAATVYDGFDPDHPAFSFSRIPITTGVFSQAFIPFATGGVYDPSGYVIQCLVGDPTAPGGMILTNEIILIYDPPPPAITSIEPNVAPTLIAITVRGTDFKPDPAQNVVYLNNIVLPVYSATQTELLVFIPEGATSGNIIVETSEGTSNPTNGYLASWLAIAPAGSYTTGNAPSVVPTPSSVYGSLSAGQQRDFVVHVEAGDELVAELYVYDPFTGRVTGQSNSMTSFFNPYLRIRRNPLSPYTVLTDDDSGPTVSAAIGLAKGSPRYVANQSEDLIVQVDSQASASGGPFLLALWTRTPVSMPVTVQGVAPSDARAGDVVTILGTGFDPATPDQNVVLMNGATAIPIMVTVSSVSFIVPDGARSGPLQVATPAGTSGYDTEYAPAWLCVHAFTDLNEVEGMLLTIPVGAIVRGAILPGTDTDEFLIDLVGGQQIAIEVHAWDQNAGGITAAYFLMATPVDPDLRILPPLGNTPILAIDQNGGPGLNAGMGLVPGGTPPFVAPWTGTFRIRVASFLGWSTGSYILAVNQVP